MLHQTIQAGIPVALRDKNQVRLDTLRAIVTAAMNELVATNRKPQDMLSDDEMLTVITRLAKQRKDAIEQFSKGGRDDLAQEEKAQLQVLEEFLPELMSPEEITTYVTGVHVASPDMAKGPFMALVMKELKGKADGAVVKHIIDSLYETN